MVLCYAHLMGFVGNYDKKLKSINNKKDMKILRLQTTRLITVSYSAGELETTINAINICFNTEFLIVGEQINIDKISLESIQKYVKNYDFEQAEDQKINEEYEDKENNDNDENKQENESYDLEDIMVDNNYELAKNVAQANSLYNAQEDDQKFETTQINLPNNQQPNQAYQILGSFHIWKPISEIPMLKICWFSGSKHIILLPFKIIIKCQLSDDKTKLYLETFNPEHYEYMQRQVFTRIPLINNIIVGGSYYRTNMGIEQVWRFFKVCSVEMIIVLYIHNCKIYSSIHSPLKVFINYHYQII